MAALVREGRIVITPGRGARLWGGEIGYGGYSCQLMLGSSGHVEIGGAKFGNGVHTSPSAQGLLPEVKGRSRSQENCWSGLINRILVAAGCGGVFLLPKIDIF